MSLYILYHVLSFFSTLPTGRIASCSVHCALMHRFLSPLCALGILIAGFPFRAGAFFDAVDALTRDARRLTFTEHMETLLKHVHANEPHRRFSDIQASSWYSPYVEQMATWGLTSGYRDTEGNLTGEFGPADPVTIAQMLKMTLTASYGDVESCPSWEEIDVRWSDHWAAQYLRCGRGISMRLLNNTDITIDRPATRAEVLAIIHDGLIVAVPPLFSTFRDTIDHPYEADIAFAAARGVVTGDLRNGESTGFFRPDDRVQRAEAVKMLYESLRADFEESM
jgi:S-layer homology domain